MAGEGVSCVSLSPWDASGPSAAEGVVQMLPIKTELGKDKIRIDMEISCTIPKKEKPPKPKKHNKEVQVEEEPKPQGSDLSSIFVGEVRSLTPVYLQEVDCVGLPAFLTADECVQIVKHAEAQGFSRQRHHNQMRLHWTDFLDPFLCDSLWQFCGLGPFLDSIVVDGMVPCGINDVVRIQKFVQGDVFGQHRDRPVRRADGRVSKYSLRVFLNSPDEGCFEGGRSTFHVPGQKPVMVEPEVGLALLYPQGELCTVQEEMEVTSGSKYVLRADVLFCHKSQLDKHRATVAHT